MKQTNHMLFFKTVNSSSLGWQQAVGLLMQCTAEEKKKHNITHLPHAMLPGFENIQHLFVHHGVRLMLQPLKHLPIQSLKEYFLLCVLPSSFMSLAEQVSYVPEANDCWDLPQDQYLVSQIHSPRFCNGVFKICICIRCKFLWSILVPHNVSS